MGRHWPPNWLPCLLIGFFVSSGTNGVPPARQAAAGDDALLVKASNYVKQYQAALVSVIATEQYSQQISGRYPPLDPVARRTRELTSDIFFLHIPGYDWMTVRDVLKVDGKEAAPDVRVADVLARETELETALRFKRDNSRYNLGTTIRTFNEPTLSLLVLDERHRRRFRFTRDNVKRDSHGTLVTYEFEETARPTLVREVSGGAAFSSGRLLIEEATGRVRSASLKVAPDGVGMTLTTEYSLDPALGMLVPVRFRERYVNGTPPELVQPRLRSFYEEVICEARYTDFRRFEVKVRIK